MSTTISTHVLDTSLGAPAAGIRVQIARVDAAGSSVVLGEGITNTDGRVPALAPIGAALVAGRYRLRFEVATYFSLTKRPSFYDEITIDFRVTDTAAHYHVPLLLSPFGYSTYRGS